MAVETGTRLLNLGHTFGDFLIVQHERVTPRFTIVNAEGVSCEEPLQPRVFLKLARRKVVAAGRWQSLQVAT